MKLLINDRFGYGTWEQILAERAEKIKQAKEAQKQARIKAKKQQDEIMEILQMGLHNIFGIGVGLLLLVLG